MTWFSATLLPQEPGICWSHKWPKEVSVIRGCCTGWSPFHVLSNEGRWLVNLPVCFLPRELIELTLACIRPTRYKVGQSSGCAKFCQSWVDVRIELRFPNYAPLKNYSPFFLVFSLEQLLSFRMMHLGTTWWCLHWETWRHDSALNFTTLRPMTVTRQWLWDRSALPTGQNSVALNSQKVFSSLYKFDYIVNNNNKIYKNM